MVASQWRDGNRLGGCVKARTVTEIRLSSERDIFIAESVYFVLNSLCGCKPMERQKQLGGCVKARTVTEIRLSSERDVHLLLRVFILY